MKVGIIGAGMIGQATGQRLVAAGHEVMISNSRGPETLADVVQSLGPSAQAGTTTDAARFGDIVLVAIPLKAIDALRADEFADKIVIDANNYYPGRDGQIAELEAGETGSSELLARQLPGARIVKAFNTIYFERIANEAQPPGSSGRLAVPMAGDDPQAKQVVGALIDDMGFDAVDAGTLADGRRQQPGTPVYNVPLTADELRAALAES